MFINLPPQEQSHVPIYGLMRRPSTSGNNLTNYTSPAKTHEHMFFAPGDGLDPSHSSRGLFLPLKSSVIEQQRCIPRAPCMFSILASLDYSSKCMPNMMVNSQAIGDIGQLGTENKDEFERNSYCATEGTNQTWVRI